MTNTIIDSILGVFTKVLTWFIDSLTSATALFYTDGNLTLIGHVTIIGFSIAVVLMILAWIRSIVRGQ